MGRYLDMVNEWEARRQQVDSGAQPIPITSAPVTQIPPLTGEVQPTPWPCPTCGGQVQLEPADDNAPSRFWTCSGCGAWGATREGAAYPTVWIGRRVM